MRSRWWLVTLLLSACSLEVSFDDTHYYCGSGGACPTGQLCVQDYCQGMPAEKIDGSVLDDDAPPASDPDADPGNPDPDAAPGTPDAAPSPPDAAPPPDAMPTCTVGHVADDFATTAAAPFWVPFNEAPTSVAESNGRLVVTLQSGASGSHFAGYVYDSNTDARGQHVEVEIANGPNSSSDATAFFKLQNGSNFGNEATFILEHGILYLDTYDVNNTRLSRKSFTFSATTHRYWALEESAGKVTFLTSSDGSSWTQRDQQPVPFPFENARVALGGGTWKAETSPGTIQFHRLNVGPSTDCFGAPQ